MTDPESRHIVTLSDDLLRRVDLAAGNYPGLDQLSVELRRDHIVEDILTVVLDALDERAGR